MPLLRGEETVLATVVHHEAKEKRPAAKKERGTPSNSPVFEALRRLRRTLADEENKPAFIIFNDTTLYEMARLMPQTLDEMLEVSGVGQHKLSCYGEQFLAVLREFT